MPLTDSSGRLAGEVAVVTGSTSGLGRTMAILFAEEGAKVVVTGRDVDRGHAVATEITEAGYEGTYVRADITEQDDRHGLVEEACRLYGPVSILVNNAFGLSSDREWMGPLLDTSPESWRDVMGIGIDAVAFMCQAVIPTMLEAGRGSIVNISSRTADRVTPRTAAYTVAKGAVVALTRSITADYTARGVRCNTLMPGYIVHEDRDLEMSDRARAAREAMQVTRLCTARDVAFAALFLASEESATIAGISLVVDGGHSVIRGRTLG